MKVAPVIFTLFGLVADPALAASAAGEDKEFDLGFARAGMTRDQFRGSTWPTGVTVICSDDKALPEELDKTAFALPKGIARFGASRCGLFSHDDTGWRPYRLDVASAATEIWGMFFPDGSGSPRLVQLFIKQPKDAFETLSAHFAEHFGPPLEHTNRLSRWSNDTNDAAIIEDGSKNLHAYVIDNKLQATMNTRMSQR